jgi:predicted esterase
MAEWISVRRREAQLIARYQGRIPKSILNRVGLLHTWEGWVNGYFDATTDEEREEFINQIELAPELTPEIVEALVRYGRAVPDNSLKPGQVSEITIGVTGYDTPPPASVYVPTSYREVEPMPLFIALHGQNGKAAQHIYGWNLIAERNNFLLIAPQADPEIGWAFSTQGIEIILAAEQHMRDRFNVDPDRIYIVGASMGGAGAWDMAMRYPQRFAGIGPRIQMPPASVTKRMDGSTDVNFPRIDNVFNLPIYYVVGAKDEKVPIDYPRMVRRKLTSMGVKIRYKEHKDGGHEAYPEESEPMAEYLLGFTRDQYPERIFLSTHESQFNIAYWAQIDDIRVKNLQTIRYKNPKGDVIEKRQQAVDAARLDVERNGNRIIVKSRSINAYSLYLSREHFDFSKPVEVRTNGKTTFEDTVSFSARTCLETARRMNDRSYLVGAVIRITDINR